MQILAGAGGFEPPNGGIKIRCLTTWLRPNAPSDCRRPAGAVGRRNIATPRSLINVAAKSRPKLVNSSYPGRFEAKDGNSIFSFLASKIGEGAPAVLRVPDQDRGKDRQRNERARHRLGATPDRHLALSPAPARSPRIALPFPPSGVRPKLCIGGRAGTI